MTRDQHWYLDEIVSRALEEAEKTVARFPQPSGPLTEQLTDEAAAVGRAVRRFGKGRITWSELENEAVQLIAVVFRLLTEGDEINGVTPPRSGTEGQPQ